MAGGILFSMFFLEDETRFIFTRPDLDIYK